MENCIGSSKYSICHEALATGGVQSPCLSLLSLGNLIQAIKICDMKPVTPPTNEQVVSLRCGIWPILSATADYMLTESFMDSATPTGSYNVPVCRICLVTLACRKQVTEPNIRIRADFQSCRVVPPWIMSVDLPVPLATVLSILPCMKPFYRLNSLRFQA